MSANNTTTQSTKMMKERTAKVRFADQDEINILQPFDPELKSTLYYSMEELHLFQKRFQVAIVLRRQAQKLNEFKRALKEDKIYMYHLIGEKRTIKIPFPPHLRGEKKATTNRSFQETPEVPTKRRRLDHLALIIV